MRKVSQLPRFVTRRLKKKSHKVKDAEMKTKLLATHAYFAHPDVSVNKIALIHDVHESSIYRWAGRYVQGGLDALIDKRTIQTPSRKRLFVTKILPVLMQMGPAFFGYPLSQWTSKHLAKALWDLYALVYSPSQIRRMLRTLGFR